jgi:hypothetical protein
VLDGTQGNWALVLPDGRRSVGLGSDLLGILRGGALPAGLLSGIQPPSVPGGEDRPRPTRNVRWAHSGFPGTLPGNGPPTADSVLDDYLSAADLERLPDRLPVPGAPVMDENGLLELVRGLAGRAGAGAGWWSLAGCVGVVRGFLRAAYGGVRLAGAVDDGVVGMGGVPGVQQGVVAGPGWGRVSSWELLEEAVAEAGPGASAVVLVSSAGDRVGHAVAMYATADKGVRWADPDQGGLVTAERPGRVDGAAGAWAVVVGLDGQVAGVPGGWSGPESAGLAGVVADPPVRHDFGAMGVEIERHDVRLIPSPWQPLRSKTLLVDSPDGMVKVVADAKRVWVSRQGVMFQSWEAMQAAGKLPHPDLAGTGGSVVVSVPEIVTAPWQVLDEPDRALPSQVLARIGEINAYLNGVEATSSFFWAGSVRLADLFAGSDYYRVTAEGQDVQVVGLAGIDEDAPLYVQPSVGVPLGGGVLAVLNYLVNRRDPDGPAPPVLESAQRFGSRVWRSYLDARHERGWDAADAVMVAEVMTLAYVQISGLLMARATVDGIVKSWMPVVARQDLADIRAALSPGVQAFLAWNADGIRERFAEDFGRMYPGFARIWRDTHKLPEDQQVDLWDVSFEDGGTGEYTVRQLIDQVLWPAVAGERIGQEDAFEVGRADSVGLDRPAGREGGGLPLVVLEIRDLPRSRYPRAGRPGLQDMADDRRMMEVLGDLAETARRGQAAAELARRLPRDAAGLLVASWLRDAVAAPQGPGRDQAAGRLRQAAGWYLDRHPGDAGAVEMVLGWFEVPGAVPALVPELGVPRPFGAPTPSGRVFLARGAPGVPDDTQDAVDAALTFPPVSGATVLHLHAADGVWRFVADDQVLKAAEFAGRVAGLGLPAGQPVILVACNAFAAAGQLAGQLGAPVIAANEDVHTLPDGRVVAARLSVTGDGAVIPIAQGDWILVRANQLPVPLGGDLLAAIRSGGLGGQLGTPLVIGQVPAGARLPARPVRWGGNMPGGSGSR